MEGHRYVEPFVGSGSLFFALKPERAVISDLNSELMRFYRTVRKHPRKVARIAHAYPVTIQKYYALRELSPDKLGKLERAARFLYLNRNCFNGIYRENRNGQFNVPMGKRTGSIPSEAFIYRASIALRGAQILDGDFGLTEKYCSSSTLFYFDPPYDYTGRRNRGEYGPKSFGIKDLERLANMLEKLDANNAKFVVSYINVDEIVPIKKRWNCLEIPVKRQIASFSKHRKTIKEVMIANF